MKAKRSLVVPLSCNQQTARYQNLLSSVVINERLMRFHTRRLVHRIHYCLLHGDYAKLTHLLGLLYRRHDRLLDGSEWLWKASIELWHKQQQQQQQHPTDDYDSVPQADPSPPSSVVVTQMMRLFQHFMNASLRSSVQSATYHEQLALEYCFHMLLCGRVDEAYHNLCNELASSRCGSSPLHLGYAGMLAYTLWRQHSRRSHVPSTINTQQSKSHWVYAVELGGGSASSGSASARSFYQRAREHFEFCFRLAADQSIFLYYYIKVCIHFVLIG
jgi:hypothetical protein